MASKVLVPTAPFAKLQVKKPTNETGTSSGFVINGEPAARVAHLEHSVRFLQEQHRLMLSGLHAEIEALRERNRDLQFQLIFNKESSPKPTTPGSDENNENEEGRLRREVARLEQEAAAARGEARAAEARALQLQRLVDAQAEKIREIELGSREVRECAGGTTVADEESSAELRARLADAERLVRRLRSDAERQRREVLAGGVTNLLFDDVAAQAAHLQCMKNSLHASLRATSLEGGFSPAAPTAGPATHHYNNYHFPAVHTPEFWREPVREDYNVTAGRGRSRRLALPELAATGHNIHRSTVYANNHTRQRPNGYEQKSKKGQTQAPPPLTLDTTSTKTPEDHERPNLESRLLQLPDNAISYPELKIVVTKLLPRINASNISQTPDGGGGGGSGGGGGGGGSGGGGGGGGGGGPKPRPRRHHQRKHATIDQT